MRLVAIVVALMLTGCIGDDVLYHQDGGYTYTLYGEQRVEPGLAQWLGYYRVSQCSEVYRPDPNEIVWWKVEAIVEHPTGRRMAGLANLSSNHIYIDRLWWDDVDVNGHEVLHLLMGLGIREGNPVFDRCDPMSNRR